MIQSTCRALRNLTLGLGEKSKRSARHGTRLSSCQLPRTHSTVQPWLPTLVLVYAWTGERDAALEQLEKVATLSGYGPTYGDLLLNPCWDDLRGDPRFDKIVAAAKAASK